MVGGGGGRGSWRRGWDRRRYLTEVGRGGGCRRRCGCAMPNKRGVPAGSSWLSALSVPGCSSTGMALGGIGAACLLQCQARERRVGIPEGSSGRLWGPCPTGDATYVREQYNNPSASAANAVAAWAVAGEPRVSLQLQPPVKTCHSAVGGVTGDCFDVRWEGRIVAKFQRPRSGGGTRKSTAFNPAGGTSVHRRQSRSPKENGLITGSWRKGPVGTCTDCIGIPQAVAHYMSISI